MFKNISEVNTNCAEGRLLMAALAKLTTESQTNKTPDEVLAQCVSLANVMYKDDGPLPETKNTPRPGFEKELENLISRYSKDEESNTPDYIIAEFMKNSMDIFHRATKLRDNWYGGRRSVINDQDKMWEVEKIGSSTAEPITQYKQIAELVCSIFHHGNFKADTHNEKELESALKSIGLWPTSEENIIKRQK